MYRFTGLVLILFFSQIILANSEPAHEKPPEDFSGAQSDQWSKIQTQLGQLKGKLDNQEKVVTELLKAKRSVEGAITPAEIDNISKQHEKLAELTKDYNKLLEEFLFRFPEKGQAANRKYIRHENQSLDEMEKNLSLEGRLKRLQKKIKAQYDPDKEISSSTEKAHEKHVEASKSKPNAGQGTETKAVDITEKITVEK